VIHPFQEDCLDVFESELIPEICHGLMKRLNRAQLAILELFLQEAKDPKVTLAQIW
jgi:hypothetical protein